MSPRKKLYDSYRSIMLVGAGMGVSLVAYFVLVKVLESRGTEPAGVPLEDSAVDLIRLIFYALSVVLIFVISFVRSVVLRAAAGESAEELVNKLFQAGVVTLALCELPAVLGLAMYFLGRMYFDFYILLAFSLVLFFFYFPRYERWKEWMDRKAGPNWEQERERPPANRQAR